jgi:hypothetical protein
MRLRFIALVAVPLSLAAGTAAGQQTLLATAVGPSYDEVANCLIRQMAPRLSGSPVVRPPPTNRAEVHLYIHGTRHDGTLPVASFFLSQQNSGSTTITFQERGDQRGLHTVAAQAAAARCAY